MRSALMGVTAQEAAISAMLNFRELSVSGVVCTNVRSPLHAGIPVAGAARTPMASAASGECFWWVDPESLAQAGDVMAVKGLGLGSRCANALAPDHPDHGSGVR